MNYSMIFDMDGTLFQTNKILERSLEETFKELREKDLWHKETPIDEYRQIMGVPLSVVWKTLLPNHSLEIHTMANVFFQDELIRNIKSGKGGLYPHVEDILTYLKAEGIEIFIASNGLPDYLQAIVKTYQLDQWVSEVFSIQQISSNDKADLVGLLKKTYNITNGAVVGDRLSDITAAHKNGLLAIGCRFDFAQDAELEQANVIIDDLLEIKAIIQKQVVMEK